MLKLIKNLLKANAFFIALAITIIIAYLSLIKIGKQPIEITNLDKIEHAIAYFILTLSWLFALNKVSKQIKREFIIVLACIFYGIIIEVLQGTITNYREASYLDILANSFGAFMAMLIFSIKTKKNNLFNI